MATPLAPDTSLRLPSVTVVSASAGSGKTYTLAMRLIQFLLSRRIPNNRLRNILAITFTNMAAAEMRQRVLAALKSLALGRPVEMKQFASFRAELLSILDTDEKSLMQLSGTIVEEILDHYTDFQVRTIDSFLGRVYKAAALEFGQEPDVKVLFDGRDLVRYAFDEFVQEEGVEGERLHLLTQLLTEMPWGDAGYPWNPYRSIVRNVLHLVRKIASQPADPSVPVVTELLREKEDALKTVAQNILARARETHAPLNTLFQKQVDLALGGNWRPLLSRKRIDAALTTGKTKAGKIARALAEDDVSRLSAEFYDLLGDLALLTARSKFTAAVLTLTLIGDILRQVKRGRGEILIDDISRELVGYLREGNVPSIYFSLGETIHHFLLDEFQDTSPVQWKALCPLIDNALSQGGSLFCVGDTKQSIFGFRGADWRIMKGLAEGSERFLSAPTDVVDLGQNYRSCRQIVEFVEDVYRKHVPDAGYGEAARLSGLADFHQEAVTQGEGHVEVMHVKRDAEQRPEKELISQLIASARQRGYRFCDIAVLTPSNKSVLEISSWFNEWKIPFMSHSSMDVRTRKLTGEILALLRFLDSPIDDHAFATVLMGEMLRRATGADPTAPGTGDLRNVLLHRLVSRVPRPLYLVFRETYADIWSGLFERLIAEAGYLPVYDLVVSIYKTFGVFSLFPDEQGGLTTFLDAVNGFEGTGTNNLKQFLTFSAEDGDDEMWNMRVQSHPDAVTIMTVHKAKGLQYPVVVALLHDQVVHPGNAVFQMVGGTTELWNVTKEMVHHSPELVALYEREEQYARADELNRLYVCLTRAEKELYVVCVKEKRVESERPTKGSRSDVNAFPSAFLPETPVGHNVRPLVEEESSDDLTAPAWIIARTDAPAKAVSLRTGERIGFAETRRGEVYHAILARIMTVVGPADEAVRSALEQEPSSSRTRPESEHIRGTLIDFLNANGVRELFAPRPARVVRCEQEFLSQSGALFRADRVVVDGDEVVVVDFKTGSSSHSGDHEVQVREYMEILHELYPGKPVRGVLAYVDQARVAEVSGGVS